MFFENVNEVIETASLRSLLQDDLPELDEEMQSKKNRQSMEEMLERNTGTAIDRSIKVKEGCPWIHDAAQCDDHAYSAFCQLLSLSFSCFFTNLAHLNILKFMIVCLNFVPALFLNLLVAQLEMPSTRSIHFLHVSPFTTSLLLVFSLGILLTVSAFVNTQYQYSASTLQVKINGALSSIISARAMSLPLQACNDLDLHDARITTIVQVDVDRFSNLAQQICDMWALPLQILLTIGALYTQVHVAFLSGLGLYTLWLPLNAYVSVMISRAKKRDMSAKDRRVQIMSEAIANMKSVKLMGLEDVVQCLSDEKRTTELYWILRGRLLDAVCVVMWAITPVIMPAATFTTCVMMGKSLSTAEVFTTLTLLNMLIFPMNAFPWVLMGYIEARVSGKRIATILWDPLTERLTWKAKTERMGVDVTKEVVREECESLSIGGQLWSWTSSFYSISRGRITTSDTSSFLLGPCPSLCMHRGNIYGVCGRVATGKSTFLLSLLGETNEVESGFVSSHHYSYCPQHPFLHEGTIQSNILFGLSLDNDKLRYILEGCILLQDVQQMPDGIMTDVGKCGGNMLSGGQRLRVGLARALYAARSVILLDDPFAALDKAMSMEIFKFLQCHAKRTGQIIIITTHTVQLLAKSAGIVHLFDGHDLSSITQSVSTTSSSCLSMSIRRGFENKGKRFVTRSIRWAPCEHSEFTRIVEHIDANASESTCPGFDDVKHTFTNMSDNDDIVPLQQDVVAKDITENYNGVIPMGVYLGYLGSMGTLNLCTLFVSLLVMQCTSDGVNLFYAYWVNAESGVSSGASNKQFLLYTGLFVVTNIVFAVSRAYSFAKGGLKASHYLYDQLVTALLTANQYFFDTNSAGHIINRVGKDTSIIDYDLPFVLNNVLAQLFSTMGTFVVICVAEPWLILLVVLVIRVYISIQGYYRHAAREIRRLEAASRSPLYSLLIDCFHDGPSIRCLKKVNHFHTMLSEAVDNNSRVSFCQVCCNQWFSLRLQLLGVAVAVSIALISVLLQFYDWINTSTVGFLAVALSYSFNLTSKMGNLMRQVALLEQEMISCERVYEYIHLFSKNSTYEENDGEAGVSDREAGVEESEDLEKALLHKSTQPTPYRRLKKTWDGRISLSHVSLTYASHLPDALRVISVQIPAGARVAIIGRSGSGKSTIFRLLTGLNKYYSGSARIDDEEINGMPRSALHEVLAVIPQDPLLFSGRLRLSLDPRNEFDDEALLHILDCVSFGKTLFSMERVSTSEHQQCCGPLFKRETSSSESDYEIGKEIPSILNFELIDGGANLSVGQRQLLCLGRALLQKKKILLIDEASSSIDSLTAKLCADALHESVENLQCTLLLITHNLQGALGNCCDHVLLMKDGEVKNFSKKEIRKYQNNDNLG